MKKPLPGAGEGKRGARGHIAYLLRQAHASVRLALDDAFRNAGLTTPQFLVLNLLDAYPGTSGAEVARVAQLTPQTVHLILRKLEAAGLIQREEHETHGRVLRIALTAEGHARLGRCKRSANAVEARLLAGLDAKTEAALRRWLVDIAR